LWTVRAHSAPRSVLRVLSGGLFSGGQRGWLAGSLVCQSSVLKFLLHLWKLYGGQPQRG